MGLFSKLFGKNVEEGSDEKKALDLLESLFKSAQDAKKNEKKDEAKPETEAAPAAPAAASDSYDEEEDGPSGFSWGPKMPAEPNQYNYKGTWREYFREIFTTEFSQYTLDVQEKNGRYMKFTFLKDGATALVVEILSASSEHKKVRSDCRAKGIPYLRYYFNYDGWWNTREYVITRTRNALGI